jgi:hypothetical protein
MTIWQHSNQCFFVTNCMPVLVCLPVCHVSHACFFYGCQLCYIFVSILLFIVCIHLYYSSFYTGRNQYHYYFASETYSRPIVTQGAILCIPKRACLGQLH